MNPKQCSNCGSDLASKLKPWLCHNLECGGEMVAVKAVSATQGAQGAGAPLIIYLQWYGDGPVTDEPIDHDNVTWCQDPINDSEAVRQIRANRPLTIEQLKGRDEQQKSTMPM